MIAIDCCRAGEVTDIRATDLWFHLPGELENQDTAWQDMWMQLTNRTRADSCMRGRIPWLALVFLPSHLLARVLAAITCYSMSIKRSQRKGNKDAKPFTTTRFALPASSSILDPLHAYVIMMRLQLANGRPLSTHVFPRAKGAVDKPEEVASMIKVIAEKALGVPCWLAG